MRLTRCFFLLMAAVTGLAAADRWWELRLAGQPSGYYHPNTESRAGGGAHTTEEMRFVVNRLGSKVEIQVHSETWEDAGGHFESLHSETSSSQQVMRVEAQRKAGGIEVRTTSGDKSYTRDLKVD